MALTPEQMALGCPNRVQVRGSYCCKALVDQPNGTACDPENCAALHIADLLVNDLRAEIYSALEKMMPQGGEVSEDAEGTEAAAEEYKG